MDELGAHVRFRDASERVVFIGLGHPIKSDDSVGLYMVSKLRKLIGSNPTRHVRILAVHSPEAAFSMIGKETRSGIKSIIIFDAIESNSPPGTIVFANITETKYGFFATHNIPLRLVPAISSNAEHVYVLGIQTENSEIGESISKSVRESADRVVDKIGKLIEES